MTVRFVDIGGIVDHHSLNCLFIMYYFVSQIGLRSRIHGKVHLIQQCVIKSVSDLQQVGSFLQS